MFGSVVLDVSIGMVFIYLLMSLIASVVQEIISAYLQLRSANLLRGIRSLFSGDSLFGKDLVDSLSNHGLIRGLYSDPAHDEAPRGSEVPAHATAAQAETRGVLDQLRTARKALKTAFQKAEQVKAAFDSNAASQEAYDQARNELAAASMQALSLAKRHKVQQAFVRIWTVVEAQQGFWRGVVRWLIRVPQTTAPAGTSNPGLLPAYIPARTFGVAMLDILNVSNVTGDGTMQAITQSLAEHHWQWQENKAGHALYALALNARGDVRAFQVSLEQWYNDSMDRASGWYKRYTQRILLCLGLLLAVFFNVDSVKVARTLWIDRDTRQAMVDAASAYGKDPAHKDAADASTPSDSKDLQVKLSDAANAFKKVTTDALLPVGWKTPPGDYLLHGWRALWPGEDPKTGERPSRDWGLIQSSTWRCFTAMMGWLVTGIAISLGAPFWFDMLNKFMVVRSTVKPQEKSRIDQSKD